MTEIHRWGALPDDDAAAFFEDAAAAIAVDLEPNPRATEIAEAARQIVLEIAADSIVAGTLKVAVLLALAGVLRTATAGARVELDKDGLRAYDGSGQVVDLNAAGTFQLGPTSGARVVITKNSVEIFDAGGVSVLKLNNATPFGRFGKDDGTAVKLDSAGALVAIFTDQIGANKVSTSGSASADTETDRTVNTEETVCSFNITSGTQTASVHVIAAIDVNALTGTNNLGLKLKIKQDSTVLDETCVPWDAIYYGGGGNDQWFRLTLQFVVSQAASTTKTYALTVQKGDGACGTTTDTTSHYKTRNAKLSALAIMR